MYDALTGLGYRVLPQVRAGSYRIDFVVEGHEGKRLAVECDGDRYHGPEKWMDDIRRQRLLERANWKFWRCWGSSFARDKTGCLKELTETLAKEGIEPIGNADVDFSGLVEFRVVGEESSVSGTDTQSEPITELTSAGVETLPVAALETSAGQRCESPVFHTPRTLGLFDNDFSDLPLYQSAPEGHPARISTSTISVGDAVTYCTQNGSDEKEEYILLLDQPSNPNLGIVNIHEDIAKALLGREAGDTFEEVIEGSRAKIKIISKHEVVS